MGPGPECPYKKEQGHRHPGGDHMMGADAVGRLQSPDPQRLPLPRRTGGGGRGFHSPPMLSVYSLVTGASQTWCGPQLGARGCRFPKLPEDGAEQVAAGENSQQRHRPPHPLPTAHSLPAAQDQGPLSPLLVLWALPTPPFPSL